MADTENLTVVQLHPEYVRTALKLLDVYIDKLNENLTSLVSVLEAGEGAKGKASAPGKPYKLHTSLLMKKIKAMLPPLKDLARHVSQMLEHMPLEDELVRFELRLRLSELEGALDAADATLLGASLVA